jgi:hypothetical protein
VLRGGTLGAPVSRGAESTGERVTLLQGSWVGAPQGNQVTLLQGSSRVTGLGVTLSQTSFVGKLISPGGGGGGSCQVTSRKQGLGLPYTTEVASPGRVGWW